jgi:hypothetical protein
MEKLDNKRRFPHSHGTAAAISLNLKTRSVALGIERALPSNPVGVSPPVKCPVYEKLRREYLDAACRFQQSRLKPPTSAEFSQTIALKTVTKERALAQTRIRLLCEKIKAVSVVPDRTPGRF